MRRTFTFVALLALGGACQGRGLGPSENANGNSNLNANQNQHLPDGAVIPPDGAPPSDGGGCASGRSTLLRSATVESIALLQDDVAEEGQTVRVVAGLSLGPCERLAAVHYRIDAGSSEIWLTAQRWVDVGVGLDCTGELAWYHEIIDFPGLTAGSWAVFDSGAGANGPSANFTVSPCVGDFDCFCEPGSQPDPVPANGECRYDCDCAAGLRCVGVYGFDMLHWQCGQTCSVDADCFGWDECMFAADGPYGLCEPKWELPETCDEVVCEEAEACVSYEGMGAWCQPDFEVWRTGETCTCDADCPAGLSCLDLGAGESAACGAPCLGDLDCPRYAICGENPAWTDTLPICFMLED